MNRRQFLKASGYFVVTAKLAGMLGCGDDGNGKLPPAGTYGFPQGVASGDPHADSVVLWTRAVNSSGAPASVEVTAQVATSEDFSKIVAEQKMTATVDADFTVRLIVNGLSAGTTYYYRFKAGSDVSTVGRTRTAPGKDDPRPINFAWVSCQDYSAGFYGAWRRMIIEDMAAAPDAQIDAVLQIGDFIYETRGDGFQAAIDENFMPIMLMDAKGNPRLIDPLPQGGATSDGKTHYALTVDDYRHLYKQFLRDPDLQAARARWPFITIWDDHEFTDDCWQTQANYITANSLDEPSQKRRVSANQAWFEFVPVNLTGAVPVAGVTGQSQDFKPATVMDAPYAAKDVDDTNLVTEPNNVAALGTMTIFRSFRYGKNVELVMTDLRQYRSDHAVPEEVTLTNPFLFAPRYALPVEMVNTFDAGKTANGGNPPAMVLNTFDNVRKASPPGTMMGAAQKQWWKDTMKKSDATWKVWASSVPIMRLLLNTESAGILPWDRVATADAWDGYPTERRELMQYLQAEDIRNVVAVSGDIHAHFAGLIYDDFDGQTPKPVIPEFTSAGISSNTVFSFFEGPTRTLPADVRQLVTYDATKLGGTEKYVRNFNTALLWGGKSAAKAAQTNDPAQALAVRDPKVNPHLSYVDTDARGYGVLRVTPTGVTAMLVTVPAPTKDYGTAGAPVKARATFTVAATPQGATPKIEGPTIEGTKPFPLT